MKITITIILIILAAQFVPGCSKKDPAGNASAEMITTPENTEKNDEPAAAAVETAVSKPQQMDTPAVPAAKQPDKLVTAAPLKGLEWIKGGPVTFEPGKVYIVEFWATWCAPCKVGIPHLTEIQKQYRDKGVTVIGISNEVSETVKPFVQKMGEAMDYAVAVDTEGSAGKNYMEAFHKNGIPQAFLIDRAGKIVWEGHPQDGMETILELVVAGNFDPAAYAKQKAEAAALQQKIMALYMDYFKKTEAGGVTEETKQLASDFIEKAPVEGLNAFAWNIMTQVKASDRDLAASLKAAEKANQLSDGKDPAVLDTYALALFENGKIQEAVQTEQKAVDMTADYPQAQEQMRQTLEKYKAALAEQI